MYQIHNRKHWETGNVRSHGKMLSAREHIMLCDRLQSKERATKNAEGWSYIRSKDTRDRTQTAAEQDQENKPTILQEERNLENNQTEILEDKNSTIQAWTVFESLNNRLDEAEERKGNPDTGIETASGKKKIKKKVKRVWTRSEACETVKQIYE